MLYSKLAQSWKSSYKMLHGFFFLRHEIDAGADEKLDTYF